MSFPTDNWRWPGQFRAYLVTMSQWDITVPSIPDDVQRVLAYTAEDAVTQAAIRFQCHEPRGPAGGSWKRIINVEPCE